MYLTKYVLDANDPTVRKSLGNCQDMHRDIQHCFGSSRAEAGVLYRLCKVKDAYCLYVLSDNKPGEARPGMRMEYCRDMNEFAENISDDSYFHFDLMCYPSVKKVCSDGRKNSRRVPIDTLDGRLNWLARKAENGGFEIFDDTLRETPGDQVSGHKSTGTLVFNSYCYHGMLRVTDADKFIETWKSGIGPEKAYGLGMLFLI